MIKSNKLLWSPSRERIDNSQIEKFRHFVESRAQRSFSSYEDLWTWSVDELESFWEEVWYYFEMDKYSNYESVLDKYEMPGCRWFTGAKLNFAEQVLKRGRPGEVAIKSVSEVRGQIEMSWDELRSQVLALANKLRALGIKPGDRIAAYMPAIPETSVAMLASTAVGAVWSSCSPDFGIKAVLERFEQIQPKVLFVVDGYRYGGKDFNRQDIVVDMQASMKSVEQIIAVSYLHEHAWDKNSDVLNWESIISGEAVDLDDFNFEQVVFEHPLWILYSSGTTGKPKGIVHSHGGILLESMKISAFHCDIGPGTTNFWMTTTGWMLWNLLHGALLAGGVMVIYDGHPSYPGPEILWSIVEDTEATFFGCSAAYINALSKTDLLPSKIQNLDKLTSISVTGSPLSAEGFSWIYDAVKENIWLSSVSGGTDICSGFVGGVPTLPVRAGEIQARLLGVAAQAYDDKGKPVEDDVGELVITKPMPSMPIYFWDDPDMQRYRESYFDVYPGIWRHGDYIEILESGACIISGRSDSTLNRFGIRIGTAEIYRVLDKIEGIKDSLIVNLDLAEGKFFMPLFVLLSEETELDDNLKKQIASALRSNCSPRHVPDEVYAVKQIPMTLTGKKLEVPVKKILMGVPIEKAANPGAMANPESLEFFANFVREKIIPV
jgi:acetoacetyl-CoA synthetase